MSVHFPQYLSTGHTYKHTYTVHPVPVRPPQLTGLVNHLNNINGEAFVTSKARLTQRLFNCPQGTRHSQAHETSKGARGQFLTRAIQIPILLLVRWDTV